MAHKKIISLNIDYDVVRRVRKDANKKERSLSWLVNNILKKAYPETKEDKIERLAEEKRKPVMPIKFKNVKLKKG